MPSPYVDARRLVKVFPTPAGDFMALRGIDLQVERGEFVAVIGKSGSGKSTLINLITGIERPTTGEIVVGGEPLHTFDEDRMAQWRGRNLGIVFQFFQLLPTLTLVENVMLPMDINRLFPPAERRERAMRLLERVGMAEQAGKRPAAVSGGQQQRVAIARALANDPSLIIADEPTGNLDSRTAETIFALFQQLADEGKTIIMVTHDEARAARTGTSRRRPLLRAAPSFARGSRATASMSLRAGGPRCLWSNPTAASCWSINWGPGSTSARWRCWAAGRAGRRCAPRPTGRWRRSPWTR